MPKGEWAVCHAETLTVLSWRVGARTACPSSSNVQEGRSLHVWESLGAVGLGPVGFVDAYGVFPVFDFLSIEFHVLADFVIRNTSWLTSRRMNRTPSPRCFEFGDAHQLSSDGVSVRRFMPCRWWAEDLVAMTLLFRLLISCWLSLSSAMRRQEFGPTISIWGWVVQ